MSPRRRHGRRTAKAFLPLAVLLVLGLIGFVAWLVYGVTHPPQHAYIVTPENFVMLSNRGLNATDETWTNRDGTSARGWLLRGTEGAPAIILLHHYGADRSWFLNLGVKISETTNCTVLWPDLRGHGQNPPVDWTSFGSREALDVLAALDYLRTLKTPQGNRLISDQAGIYGVELGAYNALLAATRDKGVQALALDSVPASPDDILNSAVRNHSALDNGLLRFLTRIGTRFYFSGNYQNKAACEAASQIDATTSVLLLAGSDAPALRDTTNALISCFSNSSKVEVHSDLSLTGRRLAPATGEQGEAYDRRVIEFFNRTLRPSK
jgi:pimeloyl-ACP methyl ester carboxylesterase